MTMSTYRDPGYVRPTLTPEEEAEFWAKLRTETPTDRRERVVARLFFAFAVLAYVALRVLARL